MLVLAACAPQVAPSAADPAPNQTQMAQGEPQSGPPNCREFTVQVMVGGQPQQAVGQACQQPDGSWQITQNTPGLPQLVYTLPPQAIHLSPYPEPYYWDPWFYGPPFFVGGSVFLADGFHRFHHHDGFHHGGFSHGGFRHGGFHGGRR
jgi:surface antigen